MHGFPATGTIGFGWFDVSGRSRVPSPPAITTAFTSTSVAACAGERPDDLTMGAYRSASDIKVASTLNESTLHVRAEPEELTGSLTIDFGR